MGSDRPRRILGSPKQYRVFDRIREILADRYELSDQDDPSFWVERGVIALVAEPRSRSRDMLLIYIGPRGGLTVVDSSEHRRRMRGRSAWTWLRLKGGRLR